MSAGESSTPSINQVKSVLDRIGQLLASPVAEVLKEFPPDEEHFVRELDRQQEWSGWREMSVHQFMTKALAGKDPNNAPSLINISFSRGVNPFWVLSGIYLKRG